MAAESTSALRAQSTDLALDRLLEVLARQIPGRQYRIVVRSQDDRGEIYVSGGYITAARHTLPTAPQIGDILLQTGMLSREQVERAYRAQVEDVTSTRPIGEYLIEKGGAQPEQIARALSIQAAENTVQLLSWSFQEIVVERDVEPINRTARLWALDVLAEWRRRMEYQSAAQAFAPTYVWPDPLAEVECPQGIAEPWPIEPGVRETVRGLANRFRVPEPAMAAWVFRWMVERRVQVHPSGQRGRPSMVLTEKDFSEFFSQQLRVWNDPRTQASPAARIAFFIDVFNRLIDLYRTRARYGAEQIAFILLDQLDRSDISERSARLTEGCDPFWQRVGRSLLFIDATRHLSGNRVRLALDVLQNPSHRHDLVRCTIAAEIDLIDGAFRSCAKLIDDALQRNHVYTLYQDFLRALNVDAAVAAPAANQSTAPCLPRVPLVGLGTERGDRRASRPPGHQADGPARSQ
jgi:hypothetical protein